MTCSRWLVLLGMGTLALGGCHTDKDTDGDTDTDIDDTEEPIVHTDEDSDTQVVDDTTIDETDTLVVDTVIVETAETGGETDGALPPQLLLISEVADYDSTVKYVEICNPGPDAAPLDGWKLGRLGTGSGTYAPIYQVDLDPLIVLEPGEAYLVAQDQSAQRTYLDTWGSDALPDQWDGNVVLGDGNDPYLLSYGGAPVDLFGDPSVTVPWYADQVALRDESIAQPRRQYRPADWTVGAFTQASPGLCMGAQHTDAPLDTFKDTFDSDNSDTYETGVVDTDVVLDIKTAADLAAGDLVITEFMPATSISSCEYVSFVVAPFSMNPFPDYVDLQGLVLSDQAGNTWTFTSSMLVVPGAEITAMPAGADDTDCYQLGGGSLRYTSFDLTDAGDIIRLRNNTEIIDQVSYAGWSASNPGNRTRAWQLDYGILDASTNDDSANWCLATTKIAGFPDFGSPGSSNDDCDVVPPDTAGDTQIVDPGDSLIETGDTQVAPPKTLDELAAGDLVITEFMADPNLVPCGVKPGEYLEIRNATSNRVDIDGLVVRVGATTATVSGTAILEPAPALLGGSTSDGSIVILVAGPLVDHCFYNNIVLPYPGRAFSYTDTIDLPAAGGAFSIGFGAVTFDTVDSSAWTPTSYTGQAWNLVDSAPTATGNDLFANWCNGGFNAGPQNVGTPGGIFGCSTP